MGSQRVGHNRVTGHALTYILHFICYSYFDGHLGCFHLLAVVSNAVGTYLNLLSLLLAKYPEVELLDHTVILFLFFLRNCHTVFHSSYII